MTYALTPTTFDGTNINDGSNYAARFEQKDDPLRLSVREPVEVEVAGGYPVSPRSQPESRTFPLHVDILANSQTALDNLHKLFDPDKGEVLLKATDGDANTWRITVQCVELLRRAGPQMFTARLYAATPVWEDDSEDSDMEECSASPTAWQITVGGTKRTLPIIELKPTASKNHANGYKYMRQVSLAHRSELPMHSTDGLPYPVDVTDSGLDLSALNGASRLQADGDDLRVYVDGKEVDRYIDATLAIDPVWCGLLAGGRIWALLKNNMTAVSPANGEWVEFSDPPGLAGLPYDGYGIIDDETIHWVDRTNTALLLSSADGRGARNTTAAAHTGGSDYLYFMEHRIEVLYDYTAAANPPASSDRQPVIDLDNSSNLVHKYPGTVFVAPRTYRPGQLLRGYTADNLLSAAISLLEESGGIKFRDVSPTAAAPQFNNLQLYCPFGVKAAAGAITHDITVEDMLGLRVYGTDLAGLEALLETYNSGNDGLAVTLTPADVLSRVRYNANIIMLTGCRAVDDADQALSDGTYESYAIQFVLDEQVELTGLLIRLKKDVGADGEVGVQVFADSSGEPDTTLAVTASFTIDTDDIATSFADHFLIFDDTATGRRPHLPAGTYWMYVEETMVSGHCYLSTASATASSMLYPRGFPKRYNGAAWVGYSRSIRFGVMSALDLGALQAEVPVGSTHEILLDDLEFTFDNTTPRTPKIVVAAEEEIYDYRDFVLTNVDTGQTITLNCFTPLNVTISIDCEAHTVIRDDTGESIPGAVDFSDLAEWFRADVGTVNLKVEETGIGTVEVKARRRDKWD